MNKTTIKFSSVCCTKFSMNTAITLHRDSEFLSPLGLDCDDKGRHKKKATARCSFL